MRRERPRPAQVSVNFADATGPSAALLSGTTSGYAAGVQNLKILPFAFASLTATGTPETFVAYDPTNQSLRGLDITTGANGNYVAAAIAEAATDANVRITANEASSVPANATINSFILVGNRSVSFDGNFNIASGALLQTARHRLGEFRLGRHRADPLRRDRCGDGFHHRGGGHDSLRSRRRSPRRTSRRTARAT